ncbi:hypothetical protein E5288_WYG019394 [Bos mutus]|uniref:Large ribosomal subunit protein uL22m n=3 Tax=Bovidae TaxID=9895 RepID=A0A6B0RDX8_9CETA|nr:hypothetical protein [Bos mutus]
MAAVILERLGALWVQNLRGKLVLGPWEELTDRSKFVESDADEELMFNIPCTGNVKLKGIIIMGDNDDSHPSEMRLYRNIPQMSFDDRDKEPDQTFSLNWDLTGELELFSSHSILPQSHIHTSASLEISRKWEKKNKIVYPPQLPGEPRRPAEIYHCRRQIKYSKDKMWYLAKLIRGMSIDQALAQLEFSDKKGAQIIKEVLLEAQDMAVRDHNVEFRSNLYIAESTSGRGQYLKRIRYHGRGRFGIMEKVFCHYFVKLVEGPPPPPEAPKTAVTHAKEYIQELRNRTIIHTL